MVPGIPISYCSFNLTLKYRHCRFEIMAVIMLTYFKMYRCFINTYNYKIMSLGMIY